MTRHYSPYSRTRTERVDRPRADYPGYGEQPSHEPYSAADHPGYRHYADATVGQDTYRGRQDHLGYGEQRYSGYGHRDSGATTAYEPHESDADDEDYEDYEAYVTTIDSRWKWIAGVAAGILLVAVICTVVILGGGDSGSVSATVAAPTQSRPPATAAPQDTAAPAPPPVASLAPETVTTVTPTPPPAPTASAAPAPAPGAVAPPPPAAANPRTITYTVTGNRQLIDLVTVIYTDQQGALQTEVNVALPWSKTVVLDPGVELKSVTATSVGGQLNCAITDAAGTALVAQNDNSMLATCTQ
ncbi:MmpS family transport accessory protein [Mycolicibacterium baixiangningiae]|uniref:MmpS family transport accessory protein n=1 Tax=Mycolicibacterium baixiangningiae TaxID=2761578 RepID=UPI0018684F19|nr:MmpS family transport accessory protein [Mycolicibacterium baixiangningiae]